MYYKFNISKKKCTLYTSDVNYIYFKQSFIMKKLMKIYNMKEILDQTFNQYLNKIIIELKDYTFIHPSKGESKVVSNDEASLDNLATIGIEK